MELGGRVPKRITSAGRTAHDPSAVRSREMTLRGCPAGQWQARYFRAAYRGQRRRPGRANRPLPRRWHLLEKALPSLPCLTAPATIVREPFNTTQAAVSREIRRAVSSLSVWISFVDEPINRAASPGWGVRATKLPLETLSSW